MQAMQELEDNPDDADIFNDTITEKCGTITYASPEQLNANYDNFDYRADIYSLGVIMLQLFCPAYS